MSTHGTRALRLGDRRIPVVLPSVRDARLHTAAVIISIHTIGILALGFRVSVPQILSAIVTAALIDVALTMRRTGQIVWPASGMLTGSGVALILRLAGMQGGDYWTWTGWYYYAGVAGVSVLTKYLVRYRGSHVFNPSNVGLVAAFLLLGSSVVEPLDFWWAPMGIWMAIAYAVILAGGVIITRRLDLLGMAVMFWVVLALGLGVLASSGHCMTAAWSVDPVCGARFWTVLVTSPEILVFVFFMITDPKTVPMGKSARLAFAGTLAIATTLLIAPQATEFGAKVGLLASLVLWSPSRGLFERLLADREGGTRRAWLLPTEAAPLATFSRGVALGSLATVVIVAIVAAGGPARTPVRAASIAQGPVSAIEVDPSDLPAVELAPGVGSVSLDIDQEVANGIALDLAENLALEHEAVRSGDAGVLASADGGARLDEMQARINEAIATGRRVAHSYAFDSLTLGIAERRGEQSSAALVLDATGTVEEIVYDAMGVEQSRSRSSFGATFVLRQLGGDRWLLVDVLS